MDSDILNIGSAIGYALALFIELLGIRQKLPWRRIALRILMFAALLAQTIHLIKNPANNTGIPISTAEWFLWAAWLIAIVYFAALFYLPRSPTGIVLLPIALGLMLSSHWASSKPLASGESLRIWSIVHGLMLLAGTVSVSIGFLAGLMYLAQSYLLKNVRSSANGVKLPSLEWLERINSRSLAISALLIALGFISGMVMRIAKHRGESAYTLWTDPVVLSLATMTFWLVAAEVFRLIYPAARQGRKVAYLTLASFIFLVIALTSFTLLDTVHASNRRVAANSRTEVMESRRLLQRTA